jgi:lipopolysaccharide assembly outer membrane protein LptD (OstA)
MMKRAALLVLVVGSSALLDAQTANTVQSQQVEQTPDVTRMTGGVTISTKENVQLKADEVEYNQRTGEMALHGTVVLRQELRPATQTTPATNLAGEPFPAPKEVVIRMRGGLEMVIGDMTVRADEADVNGLTGEMVLRGNVKMIRAKK